MSSNKNKHQSKPPQANQTSQLKSPPQQPQANQTSQPKSPPQQPQARVKPEEVSLSGHQHIQNYLEQQKKPHLNQEDLNAVLRLSQHLRVFGLLSAVGYINQSNDQEGKVRLRTVPVWRSLITDLLQLPANTTKQELMTEVVALAKNKPSEYLVMWRQSILMSNHWNFWARAYTEQD